MTRKPILRLVALLTIVAAVAAACGRGEDPATAPDPSDNYAIIVPKTLAGLTAKLSTKATARLKREARRNSYARDVQVFELRSGKELRAAFEILRLAPDARTEDVEFRKKLFGLIGGSSAAPENVDGIPVYKTKQNEQNIFVWFHGKFMQVLAVRASATQVGRAIGVDVERLKREAVALRPVKVT